jgi:hypothetical protein
VSGDSGGRLAEFPVDDVTLNLVEHAIDAVAEVDEDGTHRLVNADMNLPQLLNFLSGYDESKLRQAMNEYDQPVPDIFEYPDAIYHPFDVIRSLIAEVRRLRDGGPVSGGSEDGASE